MCALLLEPVRLSHREHLVDGMFLSLRTMRAGETDDVDHLTDLKLLIGRSQAITVFRGEVGFGVVKRIVLIIVNSHSSPSTDWDRQESPPGMTAQLLQSAGVPIDRYSFDTVETMKDLVQIRKWRRELLVAQERLAGATKAQAEARVPKVDLHKTLNRKSEQARIAITFPQRDLGLDTREALRVAI